MSNDGFLYQGDAIFRNTPSYKCFNKSFVDNSDFMYLNLNDIESRFLADAELNDNVFDCNVLQDPRTKKEVTRVLHDHTVPYKPQLGFLNARSTLTKAEHIAGLHVLQSKETGKRVAKSDVDTWNRIQPSYEGEKQAMQKSLLGYERTHMDVLYASTRKLTDLYKLWYKMKVEAILSKWPMEEDAWNTFSGLPHLKSNRSVDSPPGNITDTALIQLKGDFQLFRFDTEAMNPYRMQFRMHELFNRYLESLGCEPRLLDRVLNAELSESCESQSPTQVFMPIDSLVFLHVVGESVDFPTEMMLEIKDGPDEGRNVIRMEAPLPSRHCGRYTNDLTVNWLYKEYTRSKADWLRLDSKYSKPQKLSNEVEELDASLRDIRSYTKPEVFDEFVAKTQLAATPAVTGSNEAVFKCWLNGSEDPNDAIEMFVSTEMPRSLNGECSQFTGPTAVKMDYKSEFGCEVLTKHQLLKAWYELKLLTDSGISKGNATFLRLSSKDYHAQLVDCMTLAVIEEKLFKFYKIQMPQALAQLWQFLKLLTKMPAGKYMLRFNCKYKDQLLLCSRAKELTQNTVSVRSLLQVEPSDMLYMTMSDANYQPIDDGLCSAVHLYHQILPCAFVPVLPQKKRKQPDAKEEAKRAFVSDEEYVARKVAEKQQAAQTKHNELAKKRKNVKGRKKQNKRQQKRAEKAATLAADRELQREMEIDNILGVN